MNAERWVSKQLFHCRSLIDKVLIRLRSAPAPIDNPEHCLLGDNATVTFEENASTKARYNSWFGTCPLWTDHPNTQTLIPRTHPGRRASATSSWSSFDTLPERYLFHPLGFWSTFSDGSTATNIELRGHAPSRILWKRTPTTTYVNPRAAFKDRFFHHCLVNVCRQIVSIPPSPLGCPSGLVRFAVFLEKNFFQFRA
jgi:hypothetical protein